MSETKPEGVRMPSRAQLSTRQFRLALRCPGVFAQLSRLALLVPARFWPRRNLDLVLALQLPATEDFAQLLRDDKAWAAAVKCFSPLYHRDLETVAPGVPGTEKIYTGWDGLRAAWLEWVAPWASYRTETKEAFDAGDRVLLIVNDSHVVREARKRSRSMERQSGASATGKIARVEAYADPSEAREGFGLEQ